MPSEGKPCLGEQSALDTSRRRGKFSLVLCEDQVKLQAIKSTEVSLPLPLPGTASSGVFPSQIVPPGTPCSSVTVQVFLPSAFASGVSPAPWIHLSVSPVLEEAVSLLSLYLRQIQG